MAKKLTKNEEMSEKDFCGTDLSSFQRNNSLLKRQSFGHRFCDDLTEVVVNWLTIEDKIKMSGVSKQFQRCLNNSRLKQKVLKVTAKKTNERNGYHILMQDLSWNKFMDQTFEAQIHKLEKILKLFPNIDEIHFDGYVFVVNKEEVLNKLAEMSSHLSTFSFDFCGISVSEMTQFAQKFGPNLKSLEFCSSCDANRVLRFCPNLLSLSEVRFSRLFDDKTVLVKNLRKGLKISAINDNQMFEIFVTNNQNLTHLDIRLCLKTSADTSNAISCLSQLKQLKVLSIQMKDNDSYDKRIAESVEKIGLKCQELKSFEFDVLEGKTFDGKHFSKAFNKFSSLKRLGFRSTDNTSKQRLDINCFKNCRNLSHLKLMSDQIDDNFFLEIDSVFPYLQTLKVFLRDELSDRALQSISRLKYLNTLIIRRFGGQQLESITDSGLLSLIKCCNRLHSLFIFNTMSMSGLTINELYEKSAKNRGIFFKYYLPSVLKLNELEPKVAKNSENFDNIYIADDLKVFNNFCYNFN